MSNKQERTYDLTQYRDLDFQKITMRPTDGDDLMVAASRCVPEDGRPIDQSLFGLMLRQQTVIESITAVNGIRCNGPCLDYMQWTGRSREIVGEIYDYLNGLTTEERDGFRKALASGSLLSTSASSAASSSTPSGT